MSPYTVMVLFEAKAGKEEELNQALTEVAQHSRGEDSCLTYHVHRDASTPSKFGLYEQWKSPELHQAQVTKPYIKDFMEKAESLLAKPWEILCGV